jgi:hypothetical protein
MPVRSQATNQRPADRTARTGDQNSHRASLSARFATRSEAQVMLSLSVRSPDESKARSRASSTRHGGIRVLLAITDCSISALARLSVPTWTRAQPMLPRVLINPVL